MARNGEEHIVSSTKQSDVDFERITELAHDAQLAIACDCQERPTA